MVLNVQSFPEDARLTVSGEIKYRIDGISG
jgi:hypothetical protein